MDPFRFINNKYLAFLSGLFLISLLFFWNAIHRIFLYDCGIVYNYAYLLNLGYKPFTDFPTPLLPFPGLLQSICYKIFGLNYFSGVWGAWIVTVFQFSVIYFSLLKIRKNNFSALLYTFFITLTCLPFIGTLFYNHLLMAFISVIATQAVYIYYVHLNRCEPKWLTVYVVLQYLLIGCVIMIKLQIGVVLLGGFFFLDLFCYRVILKLNFGTIFKQLLIRGAASLSVLLLILFVTNSNFVDYLNNIKHISVIHNLSGRNIKIFFSIPVTEDPTISLSPTIFYIPIVFYLISKMKLSILRRHFSLWTHIIIISLAGALLLGSILLSFKLAIYFILTCLILFLSGSLAYLLNKLKDIKTINYLFILFFITIIYIVSFLIIMNTLERSNILLSISVLFVLVFDYLILEEEPYYFAKVFKPIIIAALLLFSLPYILLSRRKNIDFTPAPLVKYSFNSDYPELHNFFNHMNISEDSYNAFIAIDSAVKRIPSKNILFCSNLEMFNIVYGTTPPKKWPLWYHQGLSVTDADVKTMQEMVGGRNFDLIIEYQWRVPLINNIYVLQDFISNNYDTLRTSSPLIICYKKKKISS